MTRHRIDLKRELEELKKKAEGVFKPHPPLFDLRPPSSIRLGEAVPGEEVSFEHGAFYRVLVEAGSVWPEAEQFLREYLETLGSPFVSNAACLDALGPLRSSEPGSVCYLDIETTGLGTAPLFLIGLMYIAEGHLMVDQLFARDYTEEEAVLRFVNRLMPRFTTLVTFNGIQFDVPFIEDRMTVHRIGFSAPSTHIDLLPLARTVVGARTPNHRLKTLEAHLCKRKRIGDIPGAEIPDAYHQFVRTGDAKDMANIFHHNRLDLVTMLQLVTVFLAGRGE
jgi:uncharacterized protein YprB with RNaseH-like and TPR domain